MRGGARADAIFGGRPVRQGAIDPAEVEMRELAAADMLLRAMIQWLENRYNPHHPAGQKFVGSLYNNSKKALHELGILPDNEYEPHF